MLRTLARAAVAVVAVALPVTLIAHDHPSSTRPRESISTIDAARVFAHRANRSARLPGVRLVADVVPYTSDDHAHRQVAVVAAQQAQVYLQALHEAQVVRRAHVRHRPAPRVRHGARSVPQGRHGSNASIEACIIARENRGSYGRGTNPSHFGRYQFSKGTWAANGGDPAHWGNASPEEQDRVFRTTVSRNGYRDWTPYDGC